MKAVIMAGGLGERLKPFTEIIPKPLLPLGDKSIIEILIQRLKNSGVTEVILAINYRSELFESYLGDGSKHGVKITYAKEEKRLGTAGPLSNIKEQLTEPFIVINGDILTNLNFKTLYDYHVEKNADMTMVSKLINVPLHYGVVKCKDDNVIEQLEEKPVLNFDINAGIYVLSPTMFDFLKKDEPHLMTDLVREGITDGKKIVNYPLKDYWLDLGMIEDYHKAQEDFKDGVIS